MKTGKYICIKSVEPSSVVPQGVLDSRDMPLKIFIHKKTVRKWYDAVYIISVSFIGEFFMMDRQAAYPAV